MDEFVEYLFVLEALANEPNDLSFGLVLDQIFQEGIGGILGRPYHLYFSNTPASDMGNFITLSGESSWILPTA